MDHDELDERLILERYVAGRLSEDEAARFEEHYLECPECLERLELAERFHRALRGVAAEDAAVVVRGGLAAALVRLSRLRAAPWLAVAVVAVLLLPAGLAWRRAARFQDELEAARRPGINLPLVHLSPARSAPGSGEPDVRVRLAPEARWLVLALEPGDAGKTAYHATLTGPAGETVWESEGLRADFTGAVVVSLPSTLLSPGDHRLRLVPVARSSESMGTGAGAAADFPFRILPAGP